MVLESLISPFRAENRPRNLILLGLVFATIAVFLSWWIFRSYASLILVFLTSMAAIPLVYNIIKVEEEKDLQDMNEKLLLKEHGKALKAFIFLFIGMTIALAFWYVVLPSDTVSTMFQSQSETINAINGRITGLASGAESFSVFTHIFLNNLKVLVFCILFSFVYGSGAIFILTWNASVIGTAIGNFVRGKLALASAAVGLAKLGLYFQHVTIGLLKYAIHGIPEILAYFTAGLAGGIISIAVIRHDFGTRKFEHILLDSADLLLLSLFILFIAGLLEVYVTPVFFG